MTIVVIAEKPSVARDLARVLGAGRKGQGCLEGNGYCVTWALGHLVHLAEPDDYGPPWKGRWSAGQLPMIPDQWRLKLAPKTADQFKVVKALINDPATERLVCATDAGREGEHIFRLIYEQARCRKPFDRLWVSSLTDEAIRAGFRALKPGSAYDDLARAARARAQADWLIGMNLTRAYTVHNGVLCTIGRVQTPTLAMICARDVEIAGFTKTLFYELLAYLAEGFAARYTKDGETRIDKKEDAERLQREIEAAIEPQRTGTVRELEQQVQHNRPPPLYDLTSLQREANRRFGLTAAQVLELAQSLYETHKLISYPRTESRHIGEDMVDQLPGILKGLDHPQAPVALARLASGHRLGRAYVDQTKLTDHHAILPTGRPVPAGLSGPLRQVFELVQTRFVCVFLPDQVVEETRVLLAIGGADFMARGSRVLDPGWTLAEGGGAAARARATGSGSGPIDPGAVATLATGEGGEPPGTDEGQVLPPLTAGQTVHCDRLEVRERETSPPRPYTDASLLAAMKNAGRTIEDKDLARAMKASGLGTPATRAETIEKLIRTGYVERQRKQLRATEKGRGLIERVAGPLKSPELTAAWEQRLREVEEGSRPVAEFDQGIRDLVCDLIPRVWQGPAFSPEQVSQARAAQPGGGPTRGGKQGTVSRPAGLGPCPLCRQGELMETARAYGCSRFREGCTLTVWKTVAGVRLTKGQVQQLVTTGRVGPIDGFQSKAGKVFKAGLVLGTDGRVAFDFGQLTPAPPASDVQSESPAAPAAQSAVAPVAKATADPGPVGLICPKCHQGYIIQGHRGFGCNRYREGCDFAILREVAGKVLTEHQISSLIRNGRTRLIKGFSDGHGIRFDARLELDGEFQVRPHREE